MIYHFKGVPVFYQVVGQGPPLVLLHGFLERSTIWFRMVPELMKRNTIVSLDLPGHGKSGILDDTHSMELMAEVVVSLLKELKITRTGIVGHSMGGYVLLAIVELYPSIVDELFLLNSTSLADSPERLHNRKRALKVISENKKLFVQTAIPNLFTEQSRQSFPTEIATLKEEASTFRTDGISAMVRGMMIRKDRTETLRAFSRKKVIICGKDDPIVPLSDSKWIAAATNSEIKTLDGGHMSWLENTAELLKFGF